MWKKLEHEDRVKTVRLAVSAALLIALKVFVKGEGLIVAALYLAPYLVAGYDVIFRAVKNIVRGALFDECFLMAIATVGAFATGDYAEAVFVMLFYQTGELFEDVAVENSRRSISALMDIRPDFAYVTRNGELVKEDPKAVAVGDVITVKPGERIPLDGKVLTGESALDASALTGESAPRSVRPGDTVVSGCVNIQGALTVEVTKPYGESTVARILELVENSSEKKARSENFITRFAKIYTPAVVAAAALLFLVPSLITHEWGVWLDRALVFLVISCPCALVISVPLSFFGGIGGASKLGILVKGSNYLEELSKVDTVVFDKTGTLTKGRFAVTAVHPEREVGKDELLELAALAESFSDHPISRSLKEAYGKPIDSSRVLDASEISGHGVRATVDGKLICAGNDKLMQRERAKYLECELPGTIVHVTIDGFYAGHIVISDEVKEDAKKAIEGLNECGVKRTVMLTGDSNDVARNVAAAIGVSEYRAELLPADKVELTESFMRDEATGEKRTLAFVGDGINDAPVLMRADIGIAMGALGSDAAIEAADVVLMDDKPSGVASAVKIARRTLRIVRENIVFALGVKAIVLIMGALGYAPMWLAVFADVGVAFIAILNALRALNVKRV